jgi:multidrug transporter EmrE-like cation transporter
MAVLAAAIALEVLGTNALKASHGFTRLGWGAVVVIAYASSFYLLSLALRAIPLGTAYAIWSGIGTVGTAIIGVLVWREVLQPVHVLGIALVIGGVVLLNLGGAH